MPYTSHKADVAALANPAEAQYFAALASRGNGTGGGMLSQAALRGHALNGGLDPVKYLESIASSNQNQLAGQQQEQAADIAKTVISSDAANAKEGIAGIRSYTGLPYVTDFNPDIATTANAVSVNSKAADAYDKFSQGDDRYADNGYNIPEQVIGQHVAGPEAAPVAVSTGYMTPENQTNRIKANADVKSADAAMVRAQREPTTAAEKPPTYTYTTYLPGPDGQPIRTEVSGKTPPGGMSTDSGSGKPKRTPEQIAAAIARAKKLNPNKNYQYNPTTDKLDEVRK